LRTTALIPSDYFKSHSKFDIEQFFVMVTDGIYEFYVDFTINSYYFPIP